tara:strand:- start:629 stop:826 length:198 start_codon:yes stop_codon:yes gene_type:complete
MCNSSVLYPDEIYFLFYQEASLGFDLPNGAFAMFSKANKFEFISGTTAHYLVGYCHNKSKPPRLE